MTQTYSLLVADDEKVIREGIQRILAKEPIRITAVENGQKAWETLQQETFDLLLVDLMMPQMEGMELLRWVKEHIPDQIVVIITGHATIEAAVEAMKSGAYDFITKPFTPDQLRLSVKRALEKRALELEAIYLREERAKGLKDIAMEKSRIQTIVHCMASGVLVTDRDQVVVLHNPALTYLFKIPGQPLIGHPLPEIPSLKTLAEAINQVVQEDGPRTIFQESSLDEQDPVYLRAHTAAVTGDGGEVLGSVSVIEDISYLKALDLMKNAFVAMVAHELRAPLSAIQQLNTVIIEGLAGAVTDKQRELLGRSQERTKGLLDLIRDLLDISKMETGRSFQQKEPLNVFSLAEKTVDFLLPQTQAKNQTLELQAQPDLPLINADPQAIEEVLTNLLNNAIKYTPEKGTIRIELKPKNDYLLIRVSDNGIGISREDLSRIFDKFYRVKSEKTRQIVGTGLGLPIVKQLVEAHLGHVEVESQLDQGTTFNVLIPSIPKERIVHDQPSPEAK
ncbi:MAG: hybrid sensor histidine kinase/response regulator [Desulfobacca sp.]|nr:hybrid sensor histidine kinase/response regulator [Desulfobacca sp.]